MQDNGPSHKGKWGISWFSKKRVTHFGMATPVPGPQSTRKFMVPAIHSRERKPKDKHSSKSQVRNQRRMEKDPKRDAAQTIYKSSSTTERSKKGGTRLSIR